MFTEDGNLPLLGAVKPVTLKQLVEHCSDLAQKELFVSGECTRTFVASDPAGQLTLFVLPAALDLPLVQVMLRAYCHAYETQFYAVTARMWSRPVDDPDAKRTEAIVITACSRDEQVIWSRDIRRGAGVSFGPVREFPATSGYLTDLLPARLTEAERAEHRRWWETRIGPSMGVVFKHDSISNN